MTISVSCPPSLAFGVSAREIWPGRSKRWHFIYFKDSRLPFVDLYRFFCGAAEVL